MSAQLYSALGQTERRRETILEAARSGAALWDYLPEHLFVIKDEKVCPFVKFEIILPLLCCLLDTPCKQALQGMDFYDRFVDRFQDLPKV